MSYTVYAQLYRRIPFGYHPIKLERDREDYHGPCARMTRYDTHSHKSRSVPRLSNPETLKSLNPNDSKALLLARDVDSDWWPKLCPSVPLVVRGVSLKPRNPTKITVNPMSHTRCSERQNRECLREREAKRERERETMPSQHGSPHEVASSSGGTTQCGGKHPVECRGCTAEPVGGLANRRGSRITRRLPAATLLRGTRDQIRR